MRFFTPLLSHNQESRYICLDVGERSPSMTDNKKSQGGSQVATPREVSTAEVMKAAAERLAAQQGRTVPEKSA